LLIIISRVGVGFALVASHGRSITSIDILSSEIQRNSVDPPETRVS
jgi:hypothetical protein